MPRQTAMDMALERFWKNFDTATRRSAASLGQPPGTKPLGDAEKVRLWGTRDPKVDAATLAGQLTTTGVPPELLDPKSPTALAIAREAPEDLLRMYAQPTDDPELATILASLAEYPFTHGLLAGLDMPEEQVAEAERLDRLWRKQHEQPSDEADDAPTEGQGAPSTAPDAEPVPSTGDATAPDMAPTGVEGAV
jgi:hypothetical protein